MKIDLIEPAASNSYYRYTVSWQELQDMYRYIVTTNDTSKLGGTLGRLSRSWKEGESFYGAMNAAELLEKFNTGYMPKEWTKTRSLPMDLGGKGEDWLWNEDEGDYHHDEFISGESDFYIDKHIVDSKPGLTIEVDLTFSSFVSTDTLMKYGKWVGSALASVQSMGYDVRLRASSYVDDLLYRDVTSSSEFVIEILDFGQQNIPRDYAILFTDNGYRHLFFALYASYNSDYFMGRTGRKSVPVCEGLGHPRRAGWGVEWDSDRRVLHVTCDSGAASFDEDMMFNMLKEASESF